jgi:hypothetical protein
MAVRGRIVRRHGGNAARTTGSARSGPSSHLPSLSLPEGNVIMLESALVLGVFGMFAFWLWVVTVRRVSKLEQRIQALENRLSVQP